MSRLYTQSGAQHAPLRVGIALDGKHGNRVAQRVLQDVRSADFIQWTCLIDSQSNFYSTAGRTDTDGSTLQKLYASRIDARHRTAHEPTAAVDLSGELATVKQFDTSAASLASLRAEQLDVILWLSAAPVPASLLECARHGVWKFHYGDSARYRAPTPYLWELLDGAATLGVELQALRADSAPLILAQARFAPSVYPSVIVNERAPRWGSQHLMLEKLRELHQSGWERISARAHQVASGNATHVRTRAPGNAGMLQWMARLVAEKIAVRLRREARIEHWRIAIRRSATPLHQESSPQRALEQFRWIDSPRGHFWADPFLFEHRGQLWLLIEDFDYALGRAHLSACTVDASGQLGPVRRILERPYHLSYPHVFAHGGEVYMVPESSEGGAVELYRARSFPDDWVFERNLLDLPCVDTTLFFRDGRWWLFTSPMSVPGHAPITLLFSATDLHGPWSEHPDSPISRDVRFARGAGDLIESGGRLLRPSQDCSVTYGYALVFNEIERLDATAYGERAGLKLLPGWLPGLVGVHTYNRAGEFEVIDGKFMVPRSRVHD